MSNRAAYVERAKEVPFVIRDAPMPTPGPEEVIVKNSAIAINPIDWIMQREPIFPVEYPLIEGEDCAGVVHAVGSAVKDFKVGDRVAVHARSFAPGMNSSASFQLYMRSSSQIMTKIPDSLDFTRATVMPLAISTAAAGLYDSGYLGLPFPLLEPKASGKALLIWGGSSSVGAMAIQLAKASGLEVVTTASAHNADFVRGLGADFVVDHTKASAVDDIVGFLNGKSVAGAYAAVSHSRAVEHCAEVLARLDGSKFVAATMPAPEKFDGGVTSKLLHALAILDTPIAKAVWADYVPHALAQGKLKAEPEPLVVGKGLEKIQEGCDLNMKGVSAKKVVVTL